MLLVPEAEAEKPSHGIDTLANPDEAPNSDGTGQQRDSTTKKRTLMEVQTGISEEEFDSYKRSRLAADDPMASFIGKDDGQ
jgi:pre-mRNA-processing factor SLU7